MLLLQEDRHGLLQRQPKGYRAEAKKLKHQSKQYVMIAQVVEEVLMMMFDIVEIQASSLVGDLPISAHSTARESPQDAVDDREQKSS